MKTSSTIEVTLSAPESVQVANMPKFTNREMRATRELWNWPLMREDFDRKVGCSNGPQIISGLRAKGVDVSCTMVDVIDRDGNKCKSGRYELTIKGRATLQGWGWGWGGAQ